MRFLPKGGIWKNTEDEILKASVMKYGLNQWSRISSLLTRKSAKQCKARWYEWLDPAIKKTEWTREEEEKLLHLAKIMPTQWRTIAPIIGRTAAQCLEHYEQLISQHEAELDPNAPDPKRLRPGEIDPAPETKPARPDPVDMDEDELEMLQEARARLANTKGKKAKRKARERMLREARRLASVQKRNELKAAGIEMEERKDRKEEHIIDYSVEIPFQIRQPIGFYSTADEDRTEAENRQVFDFKRLTSAVFEGNPEMEETRERRKDIRRQKLYKEAFLPDAIQQINRINDPQRFVSRRAELKLPTPQVSNGDLETISKLYPEGMSLEVERDERGPNRLLGESSAASTPMPSRTPLTGDTLRKDIEDNIALKTGANPLLGGESVQLHDPNFKRKGVDLEKAGSSRIATPNVMVAAMLEKSGITPGANDTPLVTDAKGKQANKTPLRDLLSINTPGERIGTPRGNVPISGLGELPGRMALKRIEKKRLRALKRRLGGLPHPRTRGRLEIVLPQEAEDALDAVDDSQKSQIDKDDQMELKNKQVELKKASDRRRWSNVALKGLPKAGNVGEIVKKDSGKRIELAAERNFKSAAILIEKEFLKILKMDSNSENNTIFGENELKWREKAGEMIKDEIEKVKKEFPETERHLTGETERECIFNPSSKSFEFIENLNRSEKVNSLRQKFDLLTGCINGLERKNISITKKCDTLLAGYKKRMRDLKEKSKDLKEKMFEKMRELNTFKTIEKRERMAIPLRVGRLQREIDVEEEREIRLQKKYKTLFDRYKNQMDSVNKSI